MSVAIGGTFRLDPAKLSAFRPHMQAMLEASRAEDGCIAYSYAQDVLDPGLFRVFEVWRDQAALDAHARSPHMKVWRAAGAEFGLSDRQLVLYDIAGERAL